MKKTRKKGEIIWLEEIEDSAKYIRSKHAISDRMDKLIKIDKMGL